MSSRWLWYAIGTAVVTAAGALMNQAADIYQVPDFLGCAGVLWGIAGLTGLHAAAELVNEWRQWDAMVFQMRQKALATTPQTMLAEAMRGMHPSAIDVLRMYGRMTWMILPGADPESQVQWVLYGTQVSYDFIAEFLQSSNDTSCVPEWRFANEGTKHFAPKGMEGTWCTDREQYQQLMAILYGMGRVTLAHGNQPAQWIPPWKPESIARTMGIKFEADNEKEKTNE